MKLILAAVAGFLWCLPGLVWSQEEQPKLQELVEVSFNVKDHMKMKKKTVAQLKAALESIQHVKVTQPPEAPEYGYTEGRDSGPMQLIAPGSAAMRLAVPKDRTFWWSQLTEAFSKASAAVDDNTLSVQPETRLKLSGLVCDNCKKALTQKLEKLNGFGSADIDIKSEKETAAVVHFTKGTPSMAALRAAVLATPFTLHDVAVAGEEAAASGEQKQEPEKK